MSQLYFKMSMRILYLLAVLNMSNSTHAMFRCMAARFILPTSRASKASLGQRELYVSATMPYAKTKIWLAAGGILGISAAVIRHKYLKAKAEIQQS